MLPESERIMMYSQTSLFRQTLNVWELYWDIKNLDESSSTLREQMLSWSIRSHHLREQQSTNAVRTWLLKVWELLLYPRNLSLKSSLMNGTRSIWLPKLTLIIESNLSKTQSTSSKRTWNCSVSPVSKTNCRERSPLQSKQLEMQAFRFGCSLVTRLRLLLALLLVLVLKTEDKSFISWEIWKTGETPKCNSANSVRSLTRFWWSMDKLWTCS